MNCSPPGVAFAQELLDWAVQEAQRRYPATRAQPIRTVGILGAGFTGSRIAQLAWRRGFHLVVVDPQPDALERVSHLLAQASRSSQAAQPPQLAEGRAIQGNSGSSLVEANSVSQPGESPRRTLTQELTALAQCDLVLECVPENLYLKREVLCQVEGLLARQAVLATNTSTIPLSRLAQGLKNLERFCGIHFFMPIPDRPVVEVVRSGASSAQTMATAVGFVRRLGMVPLLVEDGPGFLANRLLLAWLNEALQLLEEGYLPADIDWQAQQFGWALGPFALMDWIGLDVVLAGAWQLAELFADRLVRSARLVQMVKKGQLGRKAGLGFYRYPSSDHAAQQVETGGDLPRSDLPLSGSQGFQALVGPPSEGAPIGTGEFPPDRGEPTKRPPLPQQGPSRRQALPDPSTPSTSQRSQVPTGAESEAVPRGDSSGSGSNGIVESSFGGGLRADAACLDRLHGAILVEVEQMIREGRLQDPRQVDVALVGGLGFPPALGGLLAWVDQIGLGRLIDRLADCRQASFRHHPAYPWLWRRADTHKTYYPNRPEVNSG